MNEQQTNDTGVVRLPLWRNTLETMRKDGIAYGKTYTAEWFAAQLRTDRDSMQFGLAISNIRRELESDGFYLSGRGMKGDSFVILEPASNHKVIQSYGRVALDALNRGVILGTNTRLDTLTRLERERHEKILEKMAFRLQLARNSEKLRNRGQKPPELN